MLDNVFVLSERAWSTLGGGQALLQNVHDRGKACRTEEQRARDRERGVARSIKSTKRFSFGVRAWDLVRHACVAFSWSKCAGSKQLFKVGPGSQGAALANVDACVKPY
jgi:hypothetical protein